MNSNYLESAIKQFDYYRMLAEKTFVQLTDEQLNWQYNDDSNSIAMIVNHMSGNMLSRWTNFLTTDGEKEWRNRDAEFDTLSLSRTDIIAKWNAGWECLLNALHSITEADLQKEIFIRNQGHTVLEAINRQLAHYPYHVGQIVFIGKMLTAGDWQSLSIPKGDSNQFNSKKFAQDKHRQHFTDEFLKSNTDHKSQAGTTRFKRNLNLNFLIIFDTRKTNGEMSERFNVPDSKSGVL